MKNLFSMRNFSFSSFSLSACLILSGISATPVVYAADSIQWKPWSSQVFIDAKKDHKLVLLDLEAVWCHWCHVMDQDTYRNAAVIQTINSHFIPVQVDQDAHPDLANRFRDYGWPATIVFDSIGTPLMKRAGYIEAPEMNQTLTKIATHPKVEETQPVENTLESAGSYTLSNALKKSLVTENNALYDQVHAGWGIGGDKFLDVDSEEYSILLAQRGEQQARVRAQKSLDAERKLIDPVWGGVSQYSTDGVWTHPHTEKIMSVQVDNILMYALSYAVWHRPEDLRSAKQIQYYLKTFLTSPESAFYTSQDADLVAGLHSDAYFRLNDVSRRKQGIPRVDKHIYARENGWAILSLSTLYQATGDPSALKDAETAAKWIILYRSIGNGGFSHDDPEGIDQEKVGPYLGDSLAMGEAFLSLYTSTSNHEWLSRSQQTADFIEIHFSKGNSHSLDSDIPFIPIKGGFESPSSVIGKPGLNEQNPPLIGINGISLGYCTAAHSDLPYTDRLENLRLARWLNLLSAVTGKRKYREMAERAMAYVASSSAITDDGFPAAPLLVDDELRHQPLHITVVGSKTDPLAQQLFQATLRYPASYKRLDWWDPKEGPLPNADVVYPSLAKSAAFICTNHRCSLPIFESDQLAPLIQEITSQNSR